MGYLVALLFGWWLPGLIYYLIGLYWLATVKRKPLRAIAWLISFGVLAGYSVYQGVYLKAQLEQRAANYRDMVTYAELPSDIDTILLFRSQETDAFTGYAQGCSNVCVKLLVAKRFKTVVVAVKHWMVFSYDERQRQEGIRSYRRPESYRVFTLVEEPGCKNYDNPDFYPELEQWRLTGRCIHEHRVSQVNGRYLEITTAEDMPGNPPWAVRGIHIRVVDSGRGQDILRSENAAPDLAFWFPVPGIFPHKITSGFPDGWWPDVLRINHRYGTAKNPLDVAQNVIGVRCAEGFRYRALTTGPQKSV